MFKSNALITKRQFYVKFNTLQNASIKKRGKRNLDKYTQTKQNKKKHKELLQVLFVTLKKMNLHQIKFVKRKKS